MNLINYIKSFFGLLDKPEALVTIVRRYATPNGFIGELYVDGRAFGVTCDNLYSRTGLLKKEMFLLNRLSNETTVIQYGDFTQKVPFGHCYVGSIDKDNTKHVIKELIKALHNKTAKLVVIDRLWIEK